MAQKANEIKENVSIKKRGLSVGLGIDEMVDIAKSSGNWTQWAMTMSNSIRLAEIVGF